MYFSTENRLTRSWECLRLWSYEDLLIVITWITSKSSLQRSVSNNGHNHIINLDQKWWSYLYMSNDRFTNDKLSYTEMMAKGSGKKIPCRTKMDLVTATAFAFIVFCVCWLIHHCGVIDSLDVKSMIYKEDIDKAIHAVLHIYDTGTQCTITLHSHWHVSRYY